MDRELFDDIARQMTDDFYWALSAPEVQQHEGSLVVVRNKRVLAVGTDSDALRAAAAAKEGCPEDQLVMVVVPRADLTEIPR